MDETVEKIKLTPTKVHCGFYSCKDIGTFPARFVHEKIILDVMLCEAHDRYTKQGGQLAILFDRSLAPERQP